MCRASPVGFFELFEALLLQCRSQCCVLAMKCRTWWLMAGAVKCSCWYFWFCRIVSAAVVVVSRYLRGYSIKIRILVVGPSTLGGSAEPV